MKQKHTFFVTVGIPSLFLIFSVLCLCVLSLLTLGSARTSLDTARYSMEQTENYYSACSKATETISKIRSSLTQYADSAADEAEYFSRAASLADDQNTFTWDSSEHTLSFSTDISDTQKLSVTLQVIYPKEGNPSTLEILEWSTEPASTWNPDNHQNVFKGE